MVYTQRWIVVVQPYKTENKCVSILKDRKTEAAWQWLGWGMAWHLRVWGDKQNVNVLAHMCCPVGCHFWEECGIALRPAWGMYVNLTAWHTLTPLADGLWNGWRNHFYIPFNFFFSCSPKLSHLTFEIYLGLGPVAWEGNGESASDYA